MASKQTKDDDSNLTDSGDDEDLDNKKKMRVHHMINWVSTINWLRKRENKEENKVKIQYLNNASELEKHQAIVRVFEKFDEDKSKFIEVRELRDMFEKYHIDISSEELLTLFSIVDEDKSGALDINEFK